MEKEEPKKDYSYLKKDLLKILTVVGLLVAIMVILLVLDQQTSFISRTASKIMKVLIK